mmetsp:Transcript_16820/g.50409  ORF Transcript_16820/g.50409 Transcript_16820/m.50409 type:complete len:330 (-) Transcript_16820:710-1699(-)|eukprot:358580-Chlamydomonas_euryale.AAC.2
MRSSSSRTPRCLRLSHARSVHLDAHTPQIAAHAASRPGPAAHAAGLAITPAPAATLATSSMKPGGAVSCDSTTARARASCAPTWSIGSGPPPPPRPSRLRSTPSSSAAAPGLAPSTRSNVPYGSAAHAGTAGAPPPPASRSRSVLRLRLFLPTRPASNALSGSAHGKPSWLIVTGSRRSSPGAGAPLPLPLPPAPGALPASTTTAPLADTSTTTPVPVAPPPAASADSAPQSASSWHVASSARAQRARIATCDSTSVSERVSTPTTPVGMSSMPPTCSASSSVGSPYDVPCTSARLGTASSRAPNGGTPADDNCHGDTPAAARTPGSSA